MKIIVPKSDVELFKERLSHDLNLKDVPLHPSELIPTGHYIIDEGTQMKIIYPDKKVVVIPGRFNDLFKMPKFEIKPEKLNLRKNLGD